MSKQQRTLHTLGIILRRQDFGEADRLVTLMTPTYGKRDVIAYGARKATSRKAGHLELFSLADVILNLKRELGVITSAELVEPFLPVRDDLTLGAYAGYAAELLDRFTEIGDDDNSAHLFGLLRDVLARLCETPDPRLALRYYEVRLLDVVGFRPELSVCVICGESVRPEHQYFSIADGGVVCADCGARNPNYASLSFHALKLMRHMQRNPDFKQVGSLKLNDALHTEVEVLLLGYITYVLERSLQSAEFVRRVRRMTP
jgi:DNA repair protein RecO (recombination protein O)